MIQAMIQRARCIAMTIGNKATGGGRCLTNSLGNKATGIQGSMSLAKSFQSLGVADVAKIVIPSVVSITSGGIWEKTAGSGFIIDTYGTVLTCAHVVLDVNDTKEWQPNERDPRKVIARLHNGLIRTGYVSFFNLFSDIAVVKIPRGIKGKFKPIPLGFSGSVRRGDMALCFGSPLRIHNTLTTGVISNVGVWDLETEDGYNEKNMKYLQTNAAINTGNSGGPLVNNSGEVVGIMCSKMMNAEGISFAIPIDKALKICKRYGLEFNGR
ncbi:unnamed protein product [Cochlearia groenlandica]